MSHPWRTEDFESVYARFKPGGYQLWIFARMYARRRFSSMDLAGPLPDNL